MSHTTTSLGIDLMPYGQPPTEDEKRLMRQYRAMKKEHGDHERPFTIVFYFDGEQVEIFVGSPKGKVRDES